MKAFNEHKALFLQNEGYEYINKKELSDEDKAMLAKIEELLKEHIVGFERFDNFRLGNKSKRPQIRIQYNWGADDDTRHFTGVGYLLIDDLLHGFQSLTEQA